MPAGPAAVELNAGTLNGNRVETGEPPFELRLSMHELSTRAQRSGHSFQARYHGAVSSIQKAGQEHSCKHSKQQDHHNQFYQSKSSQTQHAAHLSTALPLSIDDGYEV